MSRFSDFFVSLFGRKRPPPPAPPAPQVAPTLVPVNPFPAPATAPIGPTPMAPAPAPVPTLMTSGEPNDPGFTPEPETIDPYGRPQAGAPYGRRNTGQPFDSLTERTMYFQQLAARDKNLADWQAGFATDRYNGPVLWSDVSDDEAAFLMYVVSNYKFDGSIVKSQNDPWFAILSGTATQIAATIRRGDALTRGKYDPNVYPATGRMRGYVDDVATGRLRPTVTK